MLKIIATVIWAGTACFGLYLLALWLSHGGLRQQATRVTVFPAALIFAHPVLASTGLSLWVIFLLTHSTVYAWCGFGVLSGSAMHGAVGLTRSRWCCSRPRRLAGASRVLLAATQASRG
jgi:hypothetical protein